MTKKRLPYVVAYVNRQKEHHASKNLIPVLERDFTEEGIREPAAVYAATDERWWQEMLEIG